MKTTTTEKNNHQDFKKAHSLVRMKKKKIDALKLKKNQSFGSIISLIMASI